MKYSNYCKMVFESEIKKEKLKNIKLKVLSLFFLKSSGYIKPNIEESSYELIINSSNYSEMKKQDKLFYTYVTICHEIEHIKTFEKTKNKDFYDYEHFISLLEYISYLEENNISFNKINLGLKAKQIILESLKRNYKVSTNELKCSLVGYKKARESNLTKDRNNIDIIIKSLDFLNKNMQIYYDKNGVAIDKISYSVVKTSRYIKKYPEIIKEYKILSNFFEENGELKDLYNIYLNITEENKEFYSKYIINLLSVSQVTDKFICTLKDKEYKRYLEELINKYSNSVIDYYQKIELGRIFIEEDKALYDNLKVLLKRIKSLNELSKSCNLNKRTSMII